MQLTSASAHSSLTEGCPESSNKGREPGRKGRLPYCTGACECDTVQGWTPRPSARAERWCWDTVVARWRGAHLDGVLRHLPARLALQTKDNLLRGLSLDSGRGGGGNVRASVTLVVVPRCMQVTATSQKRGPEGHANHTHLLVEHRLGLTTVAALLAVVTPLACVGHSCIISSPPPTTPPTSATTIVATVCAVLYPTLHCVAATMTAAD